MLVTLDQEADSRLVHLVTVLRFSFTYNAQKDLLLLALVNAKWIHVFFFGERIHIFFIVIDLRFYQTIAAPHILKLLALILKLFLF